MRLSTTIGDRSFRVTEARVWKSLPPSVTSEPSLIVFNRLLKTFLFDDSFSWLHHFVTTYRVLEAILPR